jgi:hypothetical protein
MYVNVQRDFLGYESEIAPTRKKAGNVGGRVVVLITVRDRR